MKLLSRLFRKAPPPPTPLPPTAAERIATLQNAAADVVANTALGSDDTSLRVGAVRLLPDGDALRALAGLANPPAGAVTRTPSPVRHAAQERLAQLIDEGSLDFATFCRGREARAETQSVAALCKDPDRLGQLLAGIDDPAALATLAAEGPSSRVRQAAAARIDDPTQLHDLLPRVRGKDKAVYKLIKQKCDALTAERRKAEETVRESTALCESLERHSARTHDALYAATLQSLTARWRALPAHPDPEVGQRGEQALERCREVIAAHEREVARRASEQAARQAAEQEAREAREREQQARQEAAAAQAAANASASAEAATVRESEDRARADHATEQRAAEAQAHREIGSLIRLCSSALQRGDTRKAARFRSGIEEALQTAPAAAPPYLARALQQLDERLNELRQWKDYAVAPKRIELIEEMEALAGVDEEPEALAEHIRALQQEWRTINKGIAIDVSAEAERFQAAYHAAFKPCQAFFAAQAAVRRENLEARKQVLERLKAFEASLQTENPDYPFILRVLREAPLEWRSHFPVDRDAGRSVENDFHHALDRLRGILNAWHERNAEDKRALITQARHLSTVEDSAQAIDGVKRLQLLWKETGPVSRDQGNALWDEFRGLCDAVYQRREQAYTQYAAGLEAAKAHAIALCEQVEQAGNVSAEERASAHAKVREWHAAFDALEELPRNDARALRDRFERAVSKYEAGLAQLDQRDAESAESNLFEAARHIRAYERAVLQAAPDTEREALRNAAESFMAGVTRWPKGGLQALKQALTQADSASAADGESRERALRTLCIRGEILSSTPTPAIDATLRSDYEMRLLMEGLGQARQADDRDWDAMRLEWIAIGAVAPELHEDLEKRFLRCLAKRPAHSAPGAQFQNHSGRDREPRRERDSGDRKSSRDGRGRPDSGGRR